MEQEILSNTTKSLNVSKSIWVSASAGSGKTTILVKRLINLLLSDVDIKKIICITYTKNAANEMKERIYEILSKWVGLEDSELFESVRENSSNIKITDELLQKARSLFINIVDNVDNLKIFTIHSFCQQILSKFPTEAGIFPNFSIVDEIKQDKLINRAINIFLENIDKYDILLKKCFEMTMDNLSEPEIFYTIFENIIKTKENEFNIHDIMGRLAILLGLENVLVDLGFNGEDFFNLDKKFTDSFLANVENLQDIKNFFEEGKDKSKILEKSLEKMQSFINNNENIDNYLAVFLTRGGEKFAENYFLTKAAANWEKGDLFFAEQEKCFQYNKNILNLKTFCITYSLLKLADEIIKNYEVLKRQEIVLDYNDLIAKTNNLLKNKECSEWVKYKLDNKIEHVLLDEAQDTSKSQWEIIKNLVEEFFSGEGANENKRTIFVVGDEKQSIFSFQGAAPELFSKIYNNYRERLDSKDFEKVELNYSFRSGRRVLEFVNKFFEREENFRKITKLSNNIEHKAFRKIKSYVELWPLVNVENEGAKSWNLEFKKFLDGKNSAVESEEQEEEEKEKTIAKYIALKIKSFFDEKKQLLFRNGQRGRNGKDFIKYRDIMLLVEKRTSSFLFYLIKFLNSYNIPNSGNDVVENLFENIFIKDLIALLYFVNFPEYEYNLAILVKSPILNLNEVDLKRICDEKKEGTTMLEALKNLYVDRYNFLNLLIEENKKRNLYEFFVFCLEETEIKQNILKRAGMEYVSIIDEFLFFAKYFVRENGPSSVYFLHYIKNNDLKFKKEFSSELDQVRIMTRHSSKGLQAPIVFICDINQKGKNNKNPLLWTKFDDYKLPFFKTREKTAEIQALIDREEELSLEEKFRLLYVSLTRAENELYICGIENRFEKTKKGEEEKEKKTLYDIALETMKSLNCDEKVFDFDKNLKKYTFGELEETEQSIRQASLEVISNINYREKIRQLKKLKVETQKTIVHSASQFFESKNTDNFFSKDLEYRILKGKTIHKLLEILPNVNVENREEISELYIKNMFSELEEKDKEEIKKNVYKIIDDEKYSMFFKKENSRAEVPIVGEYQNIDVIGQIDRIVELEDKIVIIDYKNTLKNCENQRELPEKYITQLHIYKKVVEKQYKKPIECYILLTNYLKLLKVS